MFNMAIIRIKHFISAKSECFICRMPKQCSRKSKKYYALSNLLIVPEDKMRESFYNSNQEGMVGSLLK